MRKIEYTDIEIYSDSRVPVVKKILSGIISKVDLAQSIVTIMPDNNMIVINQLSIVYACNLKECIPDYTIFIDPRTFDNNYIEDYHIDTDEYIAFNQASSSIYLNISSANQLYFYNLNKYKLIDKIENINDYQDFSDYYMNLKADDGSKFFRGYENKFIIPIFTKYPNIANNDIANLYVYEFDIESNLVVWKIFKKKLNRDLYTIFRVMKLY